MENDKGGVHISGVQGDVSGIISGGTGNIGGKYAVVGSGTIDVSEEQLGRIQNKAQRLLQPLRLWFRLVN